MSRKTRIIISITGIIIVILALIGITFAYYLMNIDGNENAKSVKVTAGQISVLYTDLTEEDPNQVIEIDSTITKVFTVENTGNVDATYSIYLVDVINNFVRTGDIRYTLYRKVGANSINSTNYTNGDIIVEDAEFPTTASVIKANETLTLEDEIYTYVLAITYINQPTINQDADQGKTFSAKVNIRATDAETNPFSEGTLAYNIIENGALIPDEYETEIVADEYCMTSMYGNEEDCIANGYSKTNYTVTSHKQKTDIASIETFTGASSFTNEADNGLFLANDDYGQSYYYRGYIKNNYVSFAGFIWRIVRINGDDTVRLILDGSLDKVKRDGASDYAGSTTYFHYPETVGYMFGDTSQSTYSLQYANTNNSDIKTQVDTFYETYIENNSNNYHYSQYLADTLFCNDKTITSVQTVYNSYKYGAHTRLLNASTATPTLKCATGQNEAIALTEAERALSRYTANINTTINKNLLVNNDLTYPIGLLTADELVMAGAYSNLPNIDYYLYDAYKNGTLSDTWATMTPESDETYNTYIFGTSFDPAGRHISLNALHVSQNAFGVRPVINLRAGLQVTGDGTSGNPYTIK